MMSSRRAAFRGVPFYVEICRFKYKLPQLHSPAEYAIL